MGKTLSFDIFARVYGDDKFDKLSKKFRNVNKDLFDFSDNAARAFTKTANSLSNISTLGAVLQGVGQTVSGLSGLLGLLPAAAAAAGAGIATLAVGAQGFAEGFKQLADSAKIQKGTQGVADAAEQSARRIESAQQALARAVRGTKDAEETLTRAQQNAKDAQEALTRAREDATQQLEDLNRSVKNAALDEEAATLAVERAQQRLAEAQQQGASGLDLREAELGVRQAEQALEDTRDRYADLQKEAAKANAAGVEGSDQVIQAQRGVADAALGVQHAQQGVADAADEVRNAQEELARAHEDAARAANKAGAALGATTDKFDKLSANAKDTARSILGLSGAWTDMQHSVSDALFAGVGDQIKTLGGTYIPVLKTGMTGVAGEFNRGAHSLADFLSQGEQVKTVNSIFGASKAVTGQFADSLKPIVSILLDITAVGSEMLPNLTGGFSKAAQGAAEFVHNARETGALREWIQKGLDTLHKLGELFGNIGGIIAAVFQGFNAGGKNFLDTLISITGKIKDFLRSFEGQQALKALGQALAAVSSVVTEVMLTAFKELAPIIVQLAPGFAELAKQVGTILVGALQVVGPLLVALAGFISDNIDWLGPLAIGLYGAVKAFEAVGVALKVLSVLAAVNPWVLLIGATVALATLIITHWEDIKKALAAAWDWIKDVAGAAWEGIKAVIVNPIATAIEWIKSAWDSVIEFFKGIPRRIGDALSTLGGHIVDAFKAGVNVLVEAINWFLDHTLNWLIDRANDVIGFIGLPEIPRIPHIPKMHSGGVVPGIGTQEQLTILQAGETVLPRDWGPPSGMSGSWTAPPVMEVRLVISGSGALAEQVQYAFRRNEVQLEVDGKRVRVAA